MPIVALAFHEHIAMEKLNNYFASSGAGGESRATKCSKCSLAFAVVLVNRTDNKNQRYLDDLRELIDDDCINGLHRDEYTLVAGAVREE
jgi:shikimate 5-dehydrogenase